MTILRNKLFKHASFIFMLSMLTVLFIGAQIIVFSIHFKLSNIIDSLVNSSLASALFHAPVLLPILAFIFWQLIAYGILLCWIWLITTACADLFKLSARAAYGLAILNWLTAISLILILNRLYFPDSFFAQWQFMPAMLLKASNAFLLVALVCFTFETALGLVNAFIFRRQCLMVWLLLSICMLIVAPAIWNYLYAAIFYKGQVRSQQPNVLIIGFDSLRPDFLSYFGSELVATPNIDIFLQTATTYTHAYTPLARTYPAWVSILTAKYPIKTTARNNLIDPSDVLKNITLAQRFQAAGYQTIYATDEKRFSNITKAYGFDTVIGPAMGVDDFILGSLSDFPLTNLLINLPIGEYLFPFNYANRAAAVTYQPERFTQQLTNMLLRRQHKPVFLTVHLCLPHWPFAWARKNDPVQASLAQQYAASVQAVDKQFGSLLSQLKKQNLLDNTLVVLLSDHGTSLGLPGDRMITQKNYVGAPVRLKWISVAKLASAPLNSLNFASDYSINTAYGQGNDLLSYPQNHILLAFKFFGKANKARWVNQDVSLLDVAPTMLAYLNMAPMQNIDGVSLLTSSLPDTGIFLETGDSLAEVETQYIHVEQVLQHKIDLYRVNAKTGFLYVDPLAATSIAQNKQLGILWKNWLLVRYPAHIQMIMTPDAKFKRVTIQPYFVLVNLVTGKWTIGLDTSLANFAPTSALLHKLNEFYHLKN